MPLYVGKEINLANVRIPSATARIQQLIKIGEDRGLKAQDASLGGGNIRYAHRRIVITTLKRSLAFDLPLTCFDVNIMAGLFVICAGRVIHIWNLETFVLKHSLGKTGGSLHKAPIRTCSISMMGKLIATAGEDKRIIVWGVEQTRALKSIDGHKGIIYQIEFSTDSERIYSASDDGHVLVWDWKSGTIVNSCMRHPFAVRAFDFNYDRPGLVVCGRSDGHVTTWSVDHSLRIDNIIPDPEWLQNHSEENLMAWSDRDKHHTGAILAVRLSPNGRFLATASTDNTCKIWNVASYRKDLDTVQRELDETEAYDRKLNSCIDISDTTYDEQLKYQEYASLKIGEIPLSSGYHADLRYTLRHDAPVLSVRFTCNSDIVVTGSMDSTCRLWSSRKGDMLFQINTPAPVTMINVDLRDYIFLSCQNRLLIFAVKATFKEDDLPPYWQAPEVKTLVERMKARETHAPLEHKSSPKPQQYGEPTSLRTVSLPELRRLIAHGLVLPRFLDTLLGQYNDVDGKQLETNMRRHNVNARQVLRLITSNKFNPRDILKALSTKGNTTVLYSLISHGSPISGYMLKLGYRQSDDERDFTAIRLDYQDFQPPTQERNTDRHVLNKPHGDFDYSKWWEGWYKTADDLEDSDGSEDDDMFAGIERPKTQPRGKILHFIPSEQLKIIKDLQTSRNVKPIFLRQLAIESENGHAFPNFDLEEDADVPPRPLINRTIASQHSVRFNEKVVGQGKGGGASRSVTFRKQNNSSPPSMSLSDYAAWKGSFASSRTVFKPERYFQTRGLNVTFDQVHQNTEFVLPGPDGLGGGNVFTEPILIRESVGQDDRVQLVVGSPIAYRDGTIDNRSPSRQRE